MVTSKGSSSINSDQGVMEGRTGPRWSSRPSGVKLKGGERWREEEGGESGKAVETARLKVELAGPVDNPEEVAGVQCCTQSGMQWRE